MAEYRWNQTDLAAGYDAGAALVHPFYVDVQDAILTELEAVGATDGLVVDLGGGSGRMLERILERWPDMKALLVDQSQAFLDLAAKRNARFRDRLSLHCLKLQDEWASKITEPAAAVISTSAIHHLEPDEKQQCYQRCFEVLRPGGVLLNGDEVRPEDDVEYRQHVDRWASHMQGLIESEAVTPAMADALRAWQERNVTQFGQPRVSGDDCLETARVQLGYLTSAGFADVGVGWQHELWSVLRGRKASTGT